MSNYIKENIENRMKSDVNSQIICIRRRMIHHALNGKLKSSSTIDILGTDNDTNRRWIEYQFTPEMNWSKIDIDQVRLISSFEISKDAN